MLEGANWESAFETPLFTDARIGGEVYEFGPYEIFNAMGENYRVGVNPSLVLFARHHGVAVWPQWGLDMRTDVSRYHGAGMEEEIAALSSLCLGVRLKAGGHTRHFFQKGTPRGRPWAFMSSDDPLFIPGRDERFVMLPRCLRDSPQPTLTDLSLLGRLIELDAKASNALVRSARSYQSALWIAEFQPETSWLLLISAIESAANFWKKDKGLPRDRLRATMPQLEDLLLAAGGEEHANKVAELVADSMGATAKFVGFLMAFIPEPPPETERALDRPHESHRFNWEPENLERAFRVIYKWRSTSLHGGLNFPHNGGQWIKGD